MSKSPPAQPEPGKVHLKSPKGRRRTRVFGDPIEFLERTGLLGHINHKVLHPVGLSLVFHRQDGEMVFDLEDHREEPTAVMTPEDFADYLSRKDRFLREQGAEIIARRKELLGFIVQDK